MFIFDSGIEDKFLSIIKAVFGVADRNRSAQIWKEGHVEAHSSTGGTDQFQASLSGTKQNRAAQSRNRHHRGGKRQYEEVSCLN